MNLPDEFAWNCKNQKLIKIREKWDEAKLKSRNPVKKQTNYVEKQDEKGASFSFCFKKVYHLLIRRLFLGVLWTERVERDYELFKFQ